MIRFCNFEVLCANDLSDFYMKKKAVVAISGGVDSAVSASLLLEQGYEVCGVFMRHRYQKTVEDKDSARALLKWNMNQRRAPAWVRAHGDNSFDVIEQVPSRSFPFLLPVDFVAAVEVACFLGIDLVLVDVDKPFERIVDYFVQSYFDAVTPNPCILCNKTVKFSLLWNVAKRLGGDFLATGHYVQKTWVKNYLRRRQDIESDSIPFNLDLESGDPLELIKLSSNPKDQSYFLSSVSSGALRNTFFPVGYLQKTEVRRIASEKGIPVAGRSDSQEVCFIQNDDKLDFIHSVRESNPTRWNTLPIDTSGPFLNNEGVIIGKHSGYEKYTIGQRKGLGMGFGERIFVKCIRPEDKAVVLAPREDLAVTKVRAVDANWQAPIPYGQALRCNVKIRYRSASIPATVYAYSDNTIEAFLDSPCYGVAPGQSLVVYWEELLLGGGTIV